MDRKILPFVPEVFEDESLISYIYRLSHVNDHEINWIYELLGLNVNKIRGRGSLLGKEIINTSKLAVITGIDQKKLDKLALNIKNSATVIQNTLDQFAIRKVKKQFCPLCLKENIYYRNIWDISIYTRCHIHSCLLLCRCCKSNGYITTQDILNGFCKCGYMLSDNLIVWCDNSDLGYLISKKIGKSVDLNWLKSIPKELKKLEIDLIVYLILFLSFRISRVFYQRRISFSESSNFIFYDRVVNEAYIIFNNWPESFYSFLDEFKKEPKSNRQTGLQKDFGRFHRELIIKLSPINDLRFFTEEYENYIRNVWDGGNGEKALDSKFRSRYISAYQASKNLGRRTNFSPLICEGLIKGKIIDRPSKKLILVDKFSLEHYIKQQEISQGNNRNKNNRNKINRNDIKDYEAKQQGYITVAEAAVVLETSQDLINNKSNIYNGEPKLINFYHSQRYFLKVTKRTLIDYYNFLFESEIQSYIKPEKIGLERIYLNKQQLINKLNS